MQCNLITTETDLDNWLNAVTVEKKERDNSNISYRTTPGINTDLIEFQAINFLNQVELTDKRFIIT